MLAANASLGSICEGCFAELDAFPTMHPRPNWTFDTLPLVYDDEKLLVPYERRSEAPLKLLKECLIAGIGCNDGSEYSNSRKFGSNTCVTICE